MDKTILENLLKQKKKELETSLKEINREDMYLAPSEAEIDEIAAAAYQFDKMNRILLIKNNLLEMLNKIQKALQKIKENTYGICEKCKRAINFERLLAIPTTNLCIGCINQTLPIPIPL